MKPERWLLTIAIPTWNRPSDLRRCVELLLDQTNQEFALLILDNASDVPASDSLHGVIDRFGEGRARIVRNRVNIGGDPNILRCFELCETEYLWVLGDDDAPLPGAVATVLATLDANPGVLFINFACELYERTREAVTENLDDFLIHLDSFSNVLFISSGIFHRARLMAHFSAGFHFSYAMAPHITLVLKALMDGPHRCILSRQRIVHWEFPESGATWSVVTQLLGQGVLLDLPLSSENRARLARVLPRPRALDALTVQLLGYRLQSGDSDSGPYLMDQVYGRLLKYSVGPGQRFRFFFYRHVLLRMPAAGMALFRTAIRISGRGRELLSVRDPFNRSRGADCEL